MKTPPLTEPVIPPDPRLHTLFGWLFILLALPLGLWMAMRIVDKIDSRTWPKASATIVTSELYKRTGRHGTDWCIKLSYRYTIAGRQYTGRRISTSRMGDTGCVRSEAVMRARLANQQPGARITIRHAPGKPERAIVYVGALDVADFLLSAIAIVSFGGGVVAIRQAGHLRLQQAAHAADRRERMQRALEQARQRV